MSRKGLVSAIVTIAVALGAPVFAGDLDWTLRVAAIQLEPTEELQEPGETIELDDAAGVRIAAEFMVAEQIGVEPALIVTSHDVLVEPLGLPEFTLGEVDVTILTTGVNFHVSESDKVDVYLGPTLAYVMWDDLVSPDFGTFKTDDELAYGVHVGVDVPIGDRWAFSASVSWLSLDLGFDETGATTDLGVDPLLMSVGASYRF